MCISDCSSDVCSSDLLQLLPVPREAARLGAPVLCAGSRYARNDTAGILENVLIDLGDYIRHAKDVWGYEKIVLVGWSEIGRALCRDRVGRYVWVSGVEL